MLNHFPRLPQEPRISVCNVKFPFVGQLAKAPSDEGAGKLPILGNLPEGEKYKKELETTTFFSPPVQNQRFWTAPSSEGAKGDCAAKFHRNCPINGNLLGQS
jgi:hypothetical protein